MALNKTEEKIYELLKEKATSHNEEGTFCVYPRKELAFDCGVNEKTVQRTLNELERQFYIFRKRQGNGQTQKIYIITQNVPPAVRGDDFSPENVLSAVRVGDFSPENVPSAVRVDDFSPENVPPAVRGGDFSPENVPSAVRVDDFLPENVPPAVRVDDFSPENDTSTSCVNNFTPEKVRETLPQLATIIPQKHLIPNNKLANSLTKDIIGGGLIELDVGRKKDDILTRCILNYEGDNVKLTSRRSFTEYDRQVADAVTSLYEYGNKSHIITAATVYRAMVHATETETPSPQQIEAVTQSLDKLRFVRVQIDCTEELMRRNIDLNGSQITAGKIDTYLLTLDKMEIIAGGQKVVAYKVIKTPILYEYSRLTGQVITVPAALLDIRDKTGAKIPNTERRIAIKGYLMRRISIMKGQNSKNQSCHILYDSLYNEVCSTEPTQKEKRLIRDYIPCVLEYWKSEKFIKDYEELTHGKKKIGIEIKI